MKKNLIFATVVALLICIMTISASAATNVDYDLVTVDQTAGIYKIVATVRNDGCFGAFKNDLTFDRNLIIPVSAKTGNVAPIVTSPTVKTPIVAVTYFDEVNEENVSVAHSPSSPTWSVDTANVVSLVVETYHASETVKIASDELIVFEMYFKFADGKSIDDITPTSFVVDYVEYADIETGRETYKSVTEPEKNTLVVANNVANNKIASVSGAVTSAATWSATVTLIDTANPKNTFTTQTVEGAYNFPSIPYGTYRFMVTSKSHLTYTEDYVEIEKDAVKNVSLKGGDITGDNVINHYDLSDLLVVYNENNTDSDITGDGVVNHYDLSELLVNYLEKGVSE